MTDVIVLGGGVGGMSAAQELAERGFRVHVYEKRSVPGGKARSIPVPGTGIDGRQDLPGEHGFRFFPRFYRHVTDTMKRIPYPGNRDGVYGNLVQASRDMLAQFGKAPLAFPARFPRSVADVELMFEDMMQSGELGISKADLGFFAERIWQLMTSCSTRNEEQYERVSWWTYTDAANRSAAYQALLVQGLTRTLVAAKARVASTRSGGTVLTELVYATARPGRSDDNLLDGPTNMAWIDPWLTYLRELNVDYHLDAEVEAIHCKNGVIVGATIREGDKSIEVNGDYFIAAVPVEVMAKLVTDEMLEKDPLLGGIQELAKDVSWMNGLQFFLSESVPIVNGHVSYIDTPWALTSISEEQFWTIDLANYGDGNVKGVLSVDISDWDTHGILTWPEGDPNGKRLTARDCTVEQIKEEVWEQIKKSVNVDGKEILKNEVRLHSFLDPDISRDPSGRTDSEPLLVNKADTWHLRPQAWTHIPNLFLASDYVQTNTDLATMEAANEAARRAVNSIISASGANVPYCKIWKLYQPWVLAPVRWYDQCRYARGLPWRSELRLPMKLVHTISVYLNHSVRWLTRLW